MAVFDSAQANITECTFYNYTAACQPGLQQLHQQCSLIGGWLGCCVNISSCSYVGNQAAKGAGIAMQGSSKVALVDSHVSNNSAERGGGVLVSGRASMVIRNSTLMSNTARVAGGGLLTSDTSVVTVLDGSITHNSAGAEGGGGIAALNTARVFLNSTAVEHNTAAGAGGGLSLAGSAHMALGSSTPPGRYNMSVALPENTRVAPASFSLYVRGCMPGEVAPLPDTCEPCVPGFYSLDPTQALCQLCPAGADCPGGASIIPQPGWWHSAATSAQMHRCPDPAACQGDRQAVQACSLDAACRASSSYSSRQCSTAHTGHVCGACAKGFSASKPFHCRACMGAGAIIGMYVAGGFVLLAVIRMLCHFTLAENVAADEDDSKQHVSVFMRCLVLYSQWMLLVASINIDWPASISYPMQVLGWLWAPSNPETLTIDCLLSERAGVPIAVQRVVFYISMPVVMLVALLLVEATVLRAARKRSAAATAARTSTRLGSNTIVVVFFFLPGVLRTVFGFFACVPLDVPVAAPYTAAAVGSYWVYDLYLLMAFRPYAYQPAGQAMLRGMQCLLLTSYVGLTFQLSSRSVNGVQPSAAYGLVMGAVLVLANVAYDSL
ncbi:hypothetical protein OEZ86_001344 [Tetradesmus obliquus]|nr:hypothetical protein OEZ86_001344 [Tetradesmus obliquus]